MLTEQSQTPGTSNGLIGALVALIGALSAYVLRLKAGIARVTGKKVSIDDVVRGMVLEEMKKAPWTDSARETAAEAARHEIRNSAAFADLNQRLDTLEFRQTRERNDIMRGLDDLKRGLADVQSRLHGSAGD
jgi:hypothetical protein